MRQKKSVRQRVFHARHAAFACSNTACFCAADHSIGSGLLAEERRGAQQGVQYSSMHHDIYIRGKRVSGGIPQGNATARNFYVSKSGIASCA